MKALNIYRLGGVVLILAMAMFFTQCDKNDVVDPTNTILDDRGNNPDTSGTCVCLGEQFPKEELSSFEIEQLLFMREEEKLARDVYLKLGETWSATVFDHIATSEQRHMDAVLCLLDKYDIEDPAASNDNGVFENAELQELYNTLIVQGEASMSDAFVVGAMIEDKDIYDLDLALANPTLDNKDMAAVFENLMRGSRNHLRAFMRNLEYAGGSYTPLFLTQVDFDLILVAPIERGNGNCANCPNSGNQNGPHNGNGRVFGNNNGLGYGNGICPLEDTQPYSRNGKGKRRI